jgi:hypothetical protein
MNKSLRDALEKLAWLELYAPIDGATKRLAEKLIRRGVKKTVLPTDKEPIVQSSDINHNRPGEAEVPAPSSFPQKIAAFKAKYERS